MKSRRRIRTGRSSSCRRLSRRKKRMIKGSKGENYLQSNYVTTQLSY